MNAIALAPQLVALARSGLTGQPVPEPIKSELASVDWNAMTELAHVHGLVSMVHAGAIISGCTLPTEISNTSKRTSWLASMFIERAWKQLGKVLDAWKQHGIDAIVVKGVVLATRHYPSPTLRPFGDIDVLVPAHQRDQATEILLQLGYLCTDDLDAGGKAWSLENHYHWKFMRDGKLPVELHWSLSFTYPPTPADLSALWDRSELVASPIGSVRALGLEDEVLALSAHMTSHSFRLPLRSHADFAAILRQFTPEQWDRLLERAVALSRERDLLAVLGVGRALGFLELPSSVASCVDTDKSLDLKFLARYAVECPFLVAPERLLDVRNATSTRAVLVRLFRVAFPRYTHLWTPQVAAQGHPVKIYLTAWSRRATRLLGNLRDVSKVLSDSRRTDRVHRMFEGSRRKV